MLLNPYRFGSAPSGPLDSYTATLWGAYSFKLLLSAYAGPALRVRRLSDSIEHDIDFVSGVLDTAELATFVAGGSAVISKFYDQSGAGHDLQQTTSAKQPRIVNSGTFDGLAVFDASDDCLVSNTASGTPTGLTLFMKGVIRSASTTYVYAETTSDGVVNAGALIYAAPTGTTLYMGSLANRTGQIFSPTLTTVQGYRFDRSRALKSDQLALFQAGTQIGSSSSDNGGTTDSNFVSSSWNIGARDNGTSLAAPLSLYTLCIYESAKSDADIAAISGAIA